MRMMQIIGAVCERLRPVSYVDWHEVPDGPQCPYRARLSVALDRGPAGTEVREREVVRGSIEMIYSIRCPCGRRWFSPKFENVHVCPRCELAVLVHSPEAAR